MFKLWYFNILSPFILGLGLFLAGVDVCNGANAGAEILGSDNWCPETVTLSFDISHHLINKYYNTTNGRLNGGSVWTDANALESLHMLMLHTHRSDFNISDNTYIGRNALNASTDWQAFTGGYIDDAGWVVLALWAMADYKIAHGQPNVDQFLISAGTLYDKIASNWDDTCGGGVWWTTNHTYKNAITNELFLTLSAQGYLRFHNETYLENAKKTWKWLEASGMRNADGLWNDGLDFDTCLNNNETTWTYNQGVIASGLAALGVATGDHTLFDQAEITLDATIKDKTLGGILKESCDDAYPPTDGEVVCDIDQQTFKGIWMKHIQYYLEFTSDPKREAKYKGFIGAQSEAVSKYATNATLDIGNVWYTYDHGGSIYNVKSLPSGLMAHISAAEFGPCR